MEGEGDDKASPPPAPLGRSSSGASGGSKKTYEEMCEGLPPRSLLMLSLNNPIRKGAVMVVKNRNFDRAVLLLIVINCVFLAMDSKQVGFEERSVRKIVGWTENIFTAAYVLEMILKIIAMGFWWDAGS